MRPGRMEVCQALGRPRSGSCWVDEENAAQGLGGLSSRELLSCPSRPEWLRLECDFELGGDRHFSGLGVSRQVDMTRTSREQSPVSDYTSTRHVAWPVKPGETIGVAPRSMALVTDEWTMPALALLEGVSGRTAH